MIIRKVIKTSFTVISNSILQNKNISLKAKGLLCLCLSLPDDWDFNKRGIQTFSTDGRESIETAIKELKREHYLIINKIMPSKDNPKIDYEWVVYEEPYQDTDFTPIEQDTGFQDTDFQDTENPQLQNNNIQITKKQNTKLSLIPNQLQREELALYCKQENLNVDVQAFIDYYEERNWQRYDKNLKKYVPIKNWKGALRNWARNETRYAKEEKYKEVQYQSRKTYIEKNQHNAKAIEITKSFEELEKYGDMFTPQIEDKKNG